MPDGHSSSSFNQSPPAGRQPPADVALEQALLAALLYNNKAVDRVREFLQPEHFSDSLHVEIFQAICRRVESGSLADFLTLKSDLDKLGLLEGARERGEYVASLALAFVGAGTADPYARAVYDLWLRRQAIDVGEQIVGRAFDAPPGTAGDDLITEALGKLLELGEASSAACGATDLATAASGAVRRSEAAYRGDAGHGRLDTGLAPLDELWGGLWPGQLYYFMARSRTGKTPAMMQIVRHVARTLRAEAEQTGEPSGHVHVFSLEMTAEDLATINLASTTRWTADQIRSGQIGGTKDWFDLDRAGAALGRLPIIIDDRADMDLTSLMMRARIVKRKSRTRMICIDYRELIRRPRDHAKMGLPEWVPFLGYQLKALAKAANVPVLALAQINKSRDSQETTRPTLSDLPYDGGQAADAVFALHRPELYMADEPPAQAPGKNDEQKAAAIDRWHKERDAARGVAEFHAVKRRFGPTGMRKLRWDGPRMLLRELGDHSTGPEQPQRDLLGDGNEP